MSIQRWEKGAVTKNRKGECPLPFTRMPGLDAVWYLALWRQALLAFRDLPCLPVTVSDWNSKESVVYPILFIHINQPDSIDFSAFSVYRNNQEYNIERINKAGKFYENPVSIIYRNIQHFTWLCRTYASNSRSIPHGTTWCFPGWGWKISGQPFIYRGR